MFWDPATTPGRPTLGSGVLASAWSTPAHLGSELTEGSSPPHLILRLFPCLSNTFLKKKKRFETLKSYILFLCFTFTKQFKNSFTKILLQKHVKNAPQQQVCGGERVRLASSRGSTPVQVRGAGPGNAHVPRPEFSGLTASVSLSPRG